VSRALPRFLFFSAAGLCALTVLNIVHVLLRHDVYGVRQLVARKTKVNAFGQGCEGL